MARYVLRIASMCIAFTLLNLGLAEAAPSNRPFYLGVHLGQSQDEVKYILGYPPSVVDDTPSDDQFPGYRVYDTSGQDKKNSMPARMGISDYRKWSYDASGARFDLTFSKAGGALEAITCFSNGSEMCPPLYGIRDGQSEESVIRSLGNPDRSSLDGVSKTLTYTALGLTVTLTQSRVYMITLHN